MVISEEMGPPFLLQFVWFLLLACRPQFFFTKEADFWHEGPLTTLFFKFLKFSFLSYLCQFLDFFFIFSDNYERVCRSNQVN